MSETLHTSSAKVQFSVLEMISQLSHFIFYRLLVIRPIWFFSVIITNCSRLNSLGLYIVCWCAVIKLLTVSLRWIKLTRVGFRAHVKINSIAYRIVSLTHSSRSWLLSGHVLFQKAKRHFLRFLSCCASEVTTSWRYTNLFIIIIIILSNAGDVAACPVRQSSSVCVCRRLHSRSRRHTVQPSVRLQRLRPVQYPSLCVNRQHLEIP